MEDILANALKRKEELERELTRINQFIEMYNELSEKSATGGSDMHQTHSSFREVKAVRLNLGPSPMPKIKQRGRPREFADLMETILRESQRPMQRGDFVGEVESRGYTIPSGDKERYLGTILWRERNRFESVEGGYWLKGVSVPMSADDLLR